MEKKHVINCSVSSCEFYKNRKCDADTVTVCLNNTVIASELKETACSTFKCKQL